MIDQSNTNKKEWKQRLAVQILISCLKVLIVAYVLGAILLYVMQYRLLYLPSTYSQAEAIKQAELLGLQPWPQEASPPHGFTLKSPPTNVQGTVLVFHGNAGSAIDRVDYALDLSPLGFRVILVEYPGYGCREGKVGEKSMVAAAKVSVLRAVKEFPEPVYVLGESLGCGIACAVVADPVCKIAGVLVITPWDRFPDLAQDYYRFFPTRYLVRDTYDNVANLQTFSGAIGIVMAGQDEIIPTRRTQVLIDALGDCAQVWSLPEAGHNNWRDFIDSQWWSKVTDYLTEGH